MGRPRVVIFTPVYPPRKGGSATYFGTLVNMLKDRVDYTVITLNDDAPEGGDVPVLRLLPDKFSSSSLDRYVSVLPAAFGALKKVKRQGKFVMHIHSNGIYGFSASLFSRLNGIPLLKEVQDTSDPGWVLKAGKVHRWIAVGDYVRERLISFGIDSGRILTFPTINPPITRDIHLSLGEDPCKPDDRIRIVFIGWLMNRIKGVDILIKAFEKARRENGKLELMIIGDGPDKEELVKMAGKLPIQFEGEISYEGILKALGSSHMLVLPSHEEANPRVILEAYEMGIPVIATDVGGVKEEVIDGRTGILIPPGDVDSLSEAILKLADDGDLRNRMGSEGRGFLEGLPAWEDLSQRILREYRQMWDSI
ncbi:MAG: glycosyltransferase family 4 protein [Thermoplasmatota archaeon]